MLEERVRVLARQRDYLIVEAQRLSACGRCAAISDCGQRKLAGLFGNPRIELRVANPEHLPLEVGDEAIVGLTEQALLKAAALGYLLPLVMLLLPVLLLAGLGVSEGWMILAAAFGLAVGVLIARMLAPHLLAGASCSPVLLRRAS